MRDEVARLEKFLERQRLMGAAEVVHGVFVVAPEDFVVGVAEQLGAVVDESVAQVERGELEVGIFRQYLLQALLLAVVAHGDDDRVAVLGIVGEVGGEQVELLVECRLGLALGGDALGLAEVVAVAVFHNLGVEQLVQELVGGAAHLLGCRQCACDGMRRVRQALVVFLAGELHLALYLLGYHHQALHPHDVVVGEILQDGHLALLLLFLASLHSGEIRHDINAVELLHGELCHGVVGAQRVYLVVEEFDAVGEVGSKGEEVHDAATQGKLSGFHHEILALESQLLQPVDEVPHILFHALGKVQRMPRECVAGDHLLAQCVGVGDHDGSGAAAEGLHHLGAHDDVCVLRLFGVVVVGFAVGGREQHHLVFPKERFEVVGKVESLLLRGGDDQLVDVGEGFRKGGDGDGG